MADVIFCLLLAFSLCVSLLIGRFIEIKLDNIKPLKKWQEYIILYSVFFPLFSLIHLIYYPFGFYIMSFAEFIAFVLFFLMFIVVVLLSVKLYEALPEEQIKGQLEVI